MARESTDNAPRGCLHRGQPGTALRIGYLRFGLRIAPKTGADYRAGIEIFADGGFQQRFATQPRHFLVVR